MARKPSESSPKSTDSKTVGDSHSAEQPAPATGPVEIAGEPPVARAHIEPAETAGPVAITRLRKGDGRALILYRTDGAASDRA